MPKNTEIERIVDRFLGWRLPEDFSPDGGICFDAPLNPDLWPSGTNLLTATQARELVEFLLTDDEH